jgi:regulator of nucleoside diphosphate kinase
MLLCEPIASVNDKDKVMAALDTARESWLTYAPYLDFFRAELRRARAMAPTEVPDDMITMNSRFAIANPRTGDGAITYTLVYPEEESLQHGKLSVLSPMGMALFGARVGDEVFWISASGPEVARVQRLLYQPEAAGDGW